MSTTALEDLRGLVEKLSREATVEQHALIEQRTQFRKTITDELGLPDATRADILNAIRELRSSNAEAATQLQELRKAFSEQRAFLEASGTRFRKEVADALGLIDPDDAMILLWIAGIRADGAEDDRQLTLARAERDLAQAERARIQALWERDNDHHLSMMATVREFLTEDKL